MRKALYDECAHYYPMIRARDQPQTLFKRFSFSASRRGSTEASPGLEAGVHREARRSSLKHRASVHELPSPSEGIPLPDYFQGKRSSVPFLPVADLEFDDLE